MRLIGMLDSPYVRKVAVTLDLLGVPFRHEPLSVFRDFARFQQINPLVKAPTLVLADGTVLMESLLITQYVESTLPAGAALWSADPAERALECRVAALAQAACDKAVSLYYEQNLRPREFQHEPWIERVSGQLLAGWGALERDLVAHPRLAVRERSHATVMAAIAWDFTQRNLAIVVPADAHPRLAALSAAMEATATFRRWPPVGPGVPAAQA